MPTPTEINLSNTVPAANPGRQNILFAADSPYPDPNNPPEFLRDCSGSMPNHGGVYETTGTSVPIGQAQQGQIVTFDNASAVAVALDTPTDAGWMCYVKNLGAGTATIAPASGTIGGEATLALATGSDAIIFWDGTNYQVFAAGGSGGGGGGTRTEIALAPSAPGDFTVAHGLGAAPSYVLIQMTSGGAIWFQAGTRYDSTNLYLVASDAGITGYAEAFS
jgi:hypothetical protein